MSFSNTFNAWHYRFSAFTFKLNSREKILIPLTVLMIIFGISQGVLYLLDMQNTTAIDKAIVQNQTEISASNKAIESIISAQNNPEIAKLKRELEQLKPLSLQLEENIESVSNFLIPPETMPLMLEELLAKYSGLTLVSINSIAPIPVKSPTSEALLYRHGLKIRLQGSYKTISSWLADIENLQWVINWDRLNMKMEKWPQAELELEIHTLSQNQEIIGV